MVDSRCTDVRSFLESRLELLTLFLGEHRHLAEAHLADFIVDDLFTALVPTDMRLNSDGDVDEWFFMAASTSRRTSSAPIDQPPRRTLLDEFVRLAANCHLESLLLDTRMNFDDLMLTLFQVNRNADDQQRSTLLQFDAYASQKKQHEVEMMADLVAAISHKQRTVQVVDIGSGKGYLSSFLALQHGLNVLGIDSSRNNIANASKRNARLERSWSGLVERATTRAETGKPERRRSSAVATSSRATNNGSFVGITECVDETTDLTALISTNNGDDRVPVQFVLTALHTCGNLSARVLESYVREPACRSVVCVGCCYHLIDEQFCASPYEMSAGLPTAKSAFPMSSFLRQKEFSLGRNARMLACEALHRIVSQKSGPCVTLFYRALLKVILRDKYGKKYDDVHVGRLATHKLVDFTDYVRRALLKIKAPQELSDSEILSYFDKYSDYERLLKYFCRLRSLLAPAIESVILLDRLCFLHEQDNVSSSYLVRLFDPVTSPRCHAIVSFKMSMDQSK